MAYFAELDENNIVLRVISVSNHMLLDDNNIEQEHLGIDFCKSLFGGNWLQTSYNTVANTHVEGKEPFRKNYAGIDFSYNQTLDAFIPPQPDSYYLLNEDTCTWYDPLYEPLAIGVARV